MIEGAFRAAGLKVLVNPPPGGRWRMCRDRTGSVVGMRSMRSLSPAVTSTCRQAAGRFIELKLPDLFGRTLYLNFRPGAD